MSEKHPSTVARYPGSLDDLAVAIGDLRYDALAAFLASLSCKIADDGAKDGARGRVKLAPSLARLSAHLSGAARETDAAWRICEPHMPGPKPPARS